jgi:hypothetical protein
MKHIKLFESYNENNWGLQGRNGYDKHPFIGKKVLDLCPNIDLDNYGLDEDTI